MSGIERCGTILMLVAGGVWAGMIVCYAVERVNLWARMPLDQYVVDFRRSLHRADPLQPILLLVTAAGAALFALSSDGTASALAWAGLIQLGAVLVGSLVVAEPMNSQFRRLPEGEAPSEAPRLRARWARFHLARTVVTLGALSCMTVAVTYA